MKKLLIFFSTLFVFLIPHAKASPLLAIDYRTPGVTPFMPLSVEAIRDTLCSTSSCVELSNTLGRPVTVYDWVENEINKMTEAGEKFVITAERRSDNIYGVSDTDSPMFSIFLFNDEKNDFSKISLDLSKSTLWGTLYYEFAESGSINIHGWTGSSYDSCLSNKEILGMNYETQIGSVISFNTDYDLEGKYLYYTNVEFSYNFTLSGEQYPITIFHDWFSSSSEDSSVSISTGLGTSTNKYLMLRSYIEEDNFFPPEEPEPTPDNPNQGIEDGLGDLNDSINSSDISGSEGAFNDFFGNFESDDHGLFAIVSTPLNFIKSFLNSVCTPLVLPLPFVDTDVTLPCMEYVYSEFFGNFFSAYQTITTGIVAYWVCINILRIVKDMKDSEKDTIEVLDL